MCYVQNHQSNGKRISSNPRSGGGLAQLPSRLPVGLQGGRTGKLQPEPHHGLPGRVCLAGTCIRPQGALRGTGAEENPQNGRWQPPDASSTRAQSRERGKINCMHLEALRMFSKFYEIDK